MLVMLLLTVLTGVVTYQVTQNWQSANQQLSLKVVQRQFINNLYWQLKQVQLLHSQNLPKAEEQWRKIQKTVAMLDKNNYGLTLSPEIKQFIADDNSINHLPELLKREDFDFSVSDLQQSLAGMQVRTQQVTMLTSLTMVFLGLLLVAVTSLDLIRLFNALVESRELNNQIQEAERRRIAQELHDDVIQEMIVLKRQYNPERVDWLIDAMRRICNNLKPQILEDLGFDAAIESLVTEFHQMSACTISLQLSENLGQKVPMGYQLPLFRMIQELLTNIRRHAKATKASITMVYEPDESPLLRLYVKDNGCGFDPQVTKKDSLGLSGVKQRVEQLNGKLSIQSQPEGNGSLFQIRVPISQKVPNKKVLAYAN